MRCDWFRTHTGRGSGDTHNGVHDDIIQVKVELCLARP